MSATSFDRIGGKPIQQTHPARHSLIVEALAKGEAGALGQVGSAVEHPADA